MYDDTPYYARIKDQEREGANNTPTANIAKPTLPWAGEVIHRSQTASSGISPNMQWYERENAKRNRGAENEIDINQILAAKQGVKNYWYPIINSYPNEFKHVGTTIRYNWSKIKESEKIALNSNLVASRGDPTPKSVSETINRYLGSFRGIKK